MSELPKRQSLPKQAAEHIFRKIKAGEYAKQLPGERNLAERLQIGRDTLRSALEILEKQKVVSPRQHGKQRQILYQTDKKLKTKASKRIAFLSPKTLRQLSPLTLLELDNLRVLLHSNGYELDLLSPAIFQLKDPSRRLSEICYESHHDLWILYQCNASVQHWFQKNELPSIVRGYPHKGITLPCLDEDWEAAAFHAGVTLTRHGHRHIALLMPDTKLAGLRATEAGLRRAIETNQSQNSLHILKEQQDNASVTRALELSFKLKNPPTAIVVTRPRHVLTLISWLASHRLRVPNDLSLVAICYEDWFGFILPKIAHYRVDPSLLARSLIRLIKKISEDQQNPSDRKLLVPEYYSGSIQSLPE